MAILVAIGEEASEQPILTAHDLATTYNDTLVVLHVVPAEDFEDHKKMLESNPEYRDFSLDQEQTSGENFARRVVEQVLEEPDKEIIKFRGRVGDPATEIIDEVNRTNPRYLVIGGRRRSPVGKAIFGSVTQEILLNADCPVVTTLAK